MQIMVLTVVVVVAVVVVSGGGGGWASGGEVSSPRHRFPSQAIRFPAEVADP